MRGSVHCKVWRGGKHRPRRQLKWRKLLYRCSDAGAGSSHGELRAQAAIGLDFCRCISHGDKDLVFQQAAASYINYNSKHRETKRFSRERVILGRAARGKPAGSCRKMRQERCVATLVLSHPS